MLHSYEGEHVHPVGSVSYQCSCGAIGAVRFTPEPSARNIYDDWVLHRNHETDAREHSDLLDPENEDHGGN